MNFKAETKLNIYLKTDPNRTNAYPLVEMRWEENIILHIKIIHPHPKPKQKIYPKIKLYRRPPLMEMRWEANIVLRIKIAHSPPYQIYKKIGLL